MEFERLKEIIAEVLDVDMDEIGIETEFKNDLGGNSLDLMEIVMKIEDEMSISISDDDLEGIVTVKDAYEAIQRA